MTLSPHRRREDDATPAIHERDARRVVELVDAWGLARDEQAHVRAPRLRFDVFDRAHVVGPADLDRS